MKLHLILDNGPPSRGTRDELVKRRAAEVEARWGAIFDGVVAIYRQANETNTAPPTRRELLVKFGFNPISSRGISEWPTGFKNFVRRHGGWPADVRSHALARAPKSKQRKPEEWSKILSGIFDYYREAIRNGEDLPDRNTIMQMFGVNFGSVCREVHIRRGGWPEDIKDAVVGGDAAQNTKIVDDAIAMYRQALAKGETLDRQTILDKHGITSDALVRYVRNRGGWPEDIRAYAELKNKPLDVQATIDKIIEIYREAAQKNEFPTITQVLTQVGGIKVHGFYPASIQKGLEERGGWPPDVARMVKAGRDKSRRYTEDDVLQYMFKHPGADLQEITAHFSIGRRALDRIVPKLFTQFRGAGALKSSRAAGRRDPIIAYHLADGDIQQAENITQELGAENYSRVYVKQIAEWVETGVWDEIKKLFETGDIDVDSHLIDYYIKVGQETV